MKNASPDARMIEGLQLLRGIAATLVVGFHLLGAGLSRPGAELGSFALFVNGEAGVDLFFVLSGFIIYVTAHRSPTLTPARFLSARFWRIFPPYWAVLLATMSVTLAATLALGLTEPMPTPWQVFVSFFLLPLPDHVIIIAWTLGLELTFYLLFAATWRRGNRWLLGAIGLWALFAQLCHWDVIDLPQVWAVLTNSVVAEFLYGLIIAQVWISGRSRWHRIALVVGTLWMIAHVTGLLPHLPSVGREINAGLPAALIVYGLVGLPIRLPRWCLTWGEASYLLYLSHLLVFRVVGQIWMKIGPDPYSHWLSMAALGAIATAAAILGTVYLERPYQRFYRKRILHRSPT